MLDCGGEKEDGDNDVIDCYGKNTEYVNRKDGEDDCKEHIDDSEQDGCREGSGGTERGQLFSVTYMLLPESLASHSVTGVLIFRLYKFEERNT
jgi:hypothetical protein